MQLNVCNVFQNIIVQLKILKTILQCLLTHFENYKKYNIYNKSIWFCTIRPRPTSCRPKVASL